MMLAPPPWATWPIWRPLWTLFDLLSLYHARAPRLRCPGCGVYHGHPDDQAPAVRFGDAPFCTGECRAFYLAQRRCWRCSARGAPLASGLCPGCGADRDDLARYQVHP